MTKEMMALYVTAASIGFFHTLLGPDHYLPFTVMSKARNWNLSKTALITFLCGLGHVLSSVVLGLIGIGFGIGVMKLEALEAFRGNIAAWVLIGFGFMYFIWGIRNAIRNRSHKHVHVHVDTDSHTHTHTHNSQHIHVHDEKEKNITPWILFTIFVLGPCEPLIPILMYPAAKKSMMDLFMVAGIFGLVTISTMLTIVVITSLGINLLPFKAMERYSHALAGAAICICGITIQFLGL